MPYAITHLLIPIILLEMFRDYIVKNKKAFPLHYVLIGGIAGILPDLDIGLFYILSFFNFTKEAIHRTYSHSLLIPLLFLVLALISYSFKSKTLGNRHLKLRNIFLVIAFGIFIHILLDAIVAGQVMPFYPLTNYSIGLNLINLFPLSWQDTIWQSIEGALLILWLIYLELRHKISSFL